MFGLAKKELKEIRGIFFTGIVFIILWTLMCAALLFISQSESMTLDKYAIGVVLVLWVTTSALIVTPLTEGKEDGTQSYLLSLPISRSTILLTKICVGVGTAFITLVITLFLSFLLFSRDPQFLQSINPIPWNDLRLHVLFILATGIAALFSAAACKRALTAITGAFIGTAILIMLFFWVRIMWVWYPEEPLWTVAVVLFGLLLISIRTAALTIRNTQHVRRKVAVLFLFLFVIGTFAAKTEYKATYYAEPDLHKAQFHELSPDGKNLMVKSDDLAPAYLYNLESGSLHRITDRFEGMWFFSFSPSGRYILVENIRSFLGSCLIGNSEMMSFSGPRSSHIVGAMYWSMSFKTLSEWFLNMKFFVLDTVTGNRHRLVSPHSSGGRFIPECWHPTEDLIVANNWLEPGEKFYQVNLLKPDGSLDTVVEKSGIGRIEFLWDGNILRKSIMGNNPRGSGKFSYSYRAIESDEWVAEKNVTEFTNGSPDRKWKFHAIRTSEKNTFTLQLEKSAHDSDTIFDLGSFHGRKPYSLWSEGGTYLFFRRDGEIQENEFVIVNTRTRAITVLPEKITKDLLAGGYNFIERGGQFKQFSPDETWLAIGKTNLNSRLIVYSTVNGDIRISDGNVFSLGWISGNKLLLKENKKLRIWDLTENRVRDLIRKKEVITS